MSTKFFVAALYFQAALCFFIPAGAQNATNDTTKARSPKKIILERDTLISPSDLAFYISGITVIDALWDTGYFGFVQLGWFNRKVAAVPDKSTGVYLQDYENNAFGDLYQPGQPGLS